MRWMQLMMRRMMSVILTEVWRLERENDYDGVIADIIRTIGLLGRSFHSPSPMMNMMANTGWGFGLPMLWGLHLLSVIAFFTGVLFLLFWAFKHLTSAQLKQWGWALVITGSIVCLFTIGMMGHPWGGYSVRGFGSARMMWSDDAAGNAQEDAAQAKEEADGKALYDKIQTEQLACTDVSDSDFELIGEYVMGQRLGASHVLMNARMKQMMGDSGEEQMHIVIGRNATGCTVQP